MFYMIDCKAELVNDINIEGILQAWRTSRPNDAEPDFYQVLKMDVPVNEFAFFQFELTAPIAIRELICAMRNHVVWARSSRVDDLNEWPLWNSIGRAGISDCAVLFDKMQSEMKEKHQDDFRRHLPLAYMTTFSFGMSFRDLIKFLTALSDENKEIFRSVKSALILAVQNKNFVLSKKIGEAVEERWYKPHDLFPEFQPSHDALVGSFASISLKTNLQLRSQLIRHRALQFRDGFGQFFNGMLASPMSSSIDMQVLVPIDFAKDLICKRQCWIAQESLWRQMLDKLSALVGETTVPVLPCDDGICRFKRDNDLRKQKKDPSPPCPIAARLENEKMELQEKEFAIKYSEMRSHRQFWLENIERA